jgi:hypothetical protein
MPKILFKKKINDQFIQVYDDGSITKYRLDKNNKYDITIKICKDDNIYKVKWKGDLENGKGIFKLNDNRIYIGELEKNLAKEYEYIDNNKYIVVKKNGNKYFKKKFTLDWNKTDLDLLSDVAIENKT